MVTLPSAIAVSVALRDKPKRHLFNLTPLLYDELESPVMILLFLSRAYSIELSVLYLEIGFLLLSVSDLAHNVVVEMAVE